jgi:glycine cleavage system transcriptional repressor
MGQDRPGIVAAVSGALLTLGCNVEDVATSILRGHFAMMLVFAGPSGLDLSRVEAALKPLADSGDIAVTAWNVKGSLVNARATHVVSAYGPDRPGIVHAIAAALADARVNICDMACRLYEGDPPVYAVTVEVEVPEGTEAALTRRLASVAEAMSLEVSMRPLEEVEL